MTVKISEFVLSIVIGASYVPMIWKLLKLAHEEAWRQRQRSPKANAAARN